MMFRIRIRVILGLESASIEKQGPLPHQSESLELWRLTKKRCRGECTDLYQFGKDPAAIKKPDPDSYQREKPDPDPQQSETPDLVPCSDAVPQHCTALVTPNLWLY
jgi:hypothetical protein